MLCPPCRYQSRRDGRWEASSRGISEGDNDEYADFTQIVVNFIMNGSPDEVNLRYVHRLVALCTPLERGFFLLPPLLISVIPSPQRASFVVVFALTRCLNGADNDIDSNRISK